MGGAAHGQPSLLCPVLSPCSPKVTMEGEAERLAAAAAATAATTASAQALLASVAANVSAN